MVCVFLCRQWAVRVCIRGHSKTLACHCVIFILFSHFRFQIAAEKANTDGFIARFMNCQYDSTVGPRDLCCVD